MKERRPKSRGLPAPGLMPLPPEELVVLKDQVNQVAAALESGQDLETLPDLVTTRPQEPLWDLHLMSALGALKHPATPTLLAALFGTARDKARRKALKRALHLLKTRGVAVAADLLPREEASPGERAERTGLSHVTPVFGNGERYVILEGPRETLGGNFLLARISDQEGFRECHLLNLKRRQQQELWDHLRSQGLEEWLTPPPAYAVRLLNEAYALDPGAPGAGRYGPLKEKIRGHWGSPEEAPDLESFQPPVPPGESRALLEQSRQLALDPLFLNWLPGPEEIAPWLEKIKEAQDSPLILTEPQKQLRLDGVVEEAVGVLFPGERRGPLSRRLLHMAYYLDLKGRAEEARAARAAAKDLAMAAPSPLAGENPFLKALVQAALRLALEFEQRTRGAEAPSRLVAPPTESRILRR